MADIRLTDRAAARIASLCAAGGGLRLAVSGGGCSGFQYELDLVAAPGPEDVAITRAGANLFVDALSIPYLEGSEVDWVEELIGAAFKVKNPNAASSCGCGVSFSL